MRSINVDTDLLHSYQFHKTSNQSKIEVNPQKTEEISTEEQEGFRGESSNGEQNV